MRTIRHSTRHVLPLLLALLAAACQGSGGPAAAPTQLSGDRIFAQSRPATVLVYARFSSEVTIPSVSSSPDQQHALQQVIAAEAAAGHLDRTNSSAVEVATLEETAANIFSYFSPNPDPSMLMRLPSEVTLTGSGFIVGRAGVVVTNAHIVATSVDVLKPVMLRQAVQAAVPFMVGIPESVPADTRQRLTDAQVRWVMKYAEVGKTTTKLIAFTGPSIAGPLKAQQGTTADLLAAGAAIPGEDVAIIKLHGHKTWPTVALADDRGLHVGDHLYVIGYPATATLNQPLTPDASFVSRMTQGVLSGRQSMTGGWSAIATDAVTTSGDSGAPILNSRGQVVGVLTSGSVDSATGQEVQGPSIGVPVSVVKEFLATAKVKLS